MRIRCFRRFPNLNIQILNFLFHPRTAPKITSGCMITSKAKINVF